MRYFYLTAFVLLQSYVDAAIFPNSETNILGTWDEDVETNTDFHKTMRHLDNKRRENVQDNALTAENDLENEQILNLVNELFASKLTGNYERRASRKSFKHPIFNYLKHKRLRSLRRQRNFGTDSSSSSCSTKERQDLQDEMEEDWNFKKMEALNSTDPRGDVANMAAARPWAFPCGDPNQHDMAWGSCMLPVECEAEFRIYRGDSMCGRTQFVCCALQTTNYDLYQGMEASVPDTSISTGSDENRDKILGSREISRKKEHHEKKKRKFERAKRKKRMRKTIKTITQEIKRLLQRAYRNATSARDKKTKAIKDMIQKMKKEFRQDRQSIINVHHTELLAIDESLKSRLDRVRDMNHNFLTNDTFRSIVVNGTVDKEKLSAVLRQYPQLQQYLKVSRREDGGLPDGDFAPKTVEPKLKDVSPEVEEYDVEYGMIYF